MGKCLKCGRGGILFRVDKNGLCSDCAKVVHIRNNIEADLYRNNVAFRQAINANADTDKLIDLLNRAREQYRQDGNIDKLIKGYEAVLIQATKPVHSPSVAMQLVDLYVKNGQNDKAWGYMNSLLARSDYVVPRDKIRLAQSKILKKEKKYTEASEMLILAYIAKAQNQAYDVSAFEKDIKPIARKIGLDDVKIQELVSLVDGLVRRDVTNEQAVIKSFKKQLKEWGM
ncbi:MAG: hypothetical protein E7317_01755 [Clostridiales bacterium]|nr:hypothetical protein [Clostridiales bacterium]